MRPEIKAAAKQSHEKFGKAYQMMAYKWTEHTGTGKPSELADAQIVEVIARIGVFPETFFRSAGKAPWAYVKEYRPALDPDGLPYVSAEGLEDWAEYVATVYDTTVQVDSIPNIKDMGNCLRQLRYAPDTHTIPGDPEHSLARVWSER